MDIVEKINYLIKEKALTKREFMYQLQQLEPKLKTTGNIPSEQTIYGYLNGKRELKVELIPYMAEVLGVPEQAFFNSDIEYASEYNIYLSKEIREILDLLAYAPKSVREEIHHLLLEIKKVSDKNITSLKTHSKETLQTP